MNILKPAKNEMAFAKVGLMGFAGSGKSYTAALIAIGLHKLIGSKKPISYLDTETGSDFLLGKFNGAKIDLLVSKSRTFADLMEFCKETAQACEIGIIDSISHIWNELQESYIDRINQDRVRKNREKITRLEFQHWQPIKREWGKFTDVFLTSKLHLIVCGRAGYEYDFAENEDGKKELQKTGTKMKAESEMSYEPSLLVEMERIDINPAFGSGRSRKGDRGARTVMNRAFIKKDRFDVLDGQTFDNPTFETFLPHFCLLNLGGDHRAIESQTKSSGLFDGEGNDQYQRDRKNRDILLEKIQNILLIHHSGQTQEEKKTRLLLVRKFFNVEAWGELERMDPAYLNDCYKELKEHLEPQDKKNDSTTANPTA
jgi:hypothetical protein